MATVPTYGVQKVSAAPADGTKQQIDINPSAFGSSIARATQNLGGQIEDTGGMLAQNALRMKKEDDLARAKEADVRAGDAIRDLMLNDETGFLLQKGKNAVDQFDTARKSIEEIKKSISKDLTPDQQVLFNDAFAQRQETAYNRQYSHLASERISYQNDLSEARMVSAIEDAASLYKDPTAIGEAKRILNGELSQKASREGWDSEIAEFEKDKKFTELHKAVIASYAADDAFGATEYYKENKDSILGGDQTELETFLKGRRLDQMGSMIFDQVDQSKFDEARGLVEKFSSDLEGDERFRLNSQIDAAETRYLKKVEEMGESALMKDRVEAAIKGLSYLDPKDKSAGGDVKSVDTYYEKYLLPSLDGQPQEVVDAVGTLYAAKTGIIPDAMQGEIRGTLRSSESAEEIARVSEIVSQIQTQNPRALVDMSDRDVEMATWVASAVNAGVEPKEAVNTYRAASQVPEAIRKQRRVDAGKTTKFMEAGGGKNNDPVADAFDKGFFSSQPDAGEVVTAEYRDLFIKAYEATGDEDVAHKMALHGIKRVWSESRINGDKELMKHAPEMVYGTYGKVGKDAEWIRGQLLDDLADNALWPEGWQDRISLVSDPLTPRTLDYLIRVEQADGTVDFYRDGENNILRWKPDWETSKDGIKQEAKRKEVLEKKVAQGKADRDLYIRSYEATEFYRDLGLNPDMILGGR